MSALSHLSVFHEAQKGGWVNTRSGKSLQSKLPSEQSKGFEFVSAGELTATPTSVAYLIDGLIETEALCLLFAPPSAGKSFVSISMSAAIATGMDWLGRRTQQGAVFYLAGEGHAGLRRRLKAWEVHNGDGLTDAPLFISKTSAALMCEESAQAVTDAIRTLCSQHGAPRLIVIDTFARNMGDGDENSNADVGVFINRIDKMRSEIVCAVLLVHHSGHAATDRARGASALLAAMDTAFRLEKTGSGMTMTHIKAKESEENQPLALALEQVTLPGWFDANGDEMNSAVIVAGTADACEVAPLTPSQKHALDLFRDAIKAHGQLSTDGRIPGLHVDVWRDAYYRQSSASNMNSKKTAFLRIREKLVSLGRLSLNGDFYCFSGLTGLVENYEADAAIRARNENGTPAH